MLWKTKKQAMENYDFMKTTIRQFSYLQGHYGRLLREIYENEKADESFAVECAKNLPDFHKSMYNVIAYLEGF